jgi:predicted nucleotidyltransferase
MIDRIKNQRQQIADICHRLGVRRLEVFGSAATGEFNPETSDVDFIAEFDDKDYSEGLLTRYLDLSTQLESLLGVAVDVVTPRSIRNPYFRAGVNASTESLYAA